jgi:hypothetical protein
LEQTQTCGDAVWKHNLYVYDSSGIRVYIDGQEVVNNNSTFTSSLSLAYIGNRPSFGTNGLDGNIDDLFFSSDILDDTDATRIYQQGLQGHPMRWQ